MSYTKSMFHKIAKEALRIAEEEDCKQLDEDDVFFLADALAHILVNRDYDKPECYAAEFVACELGDMSYVFDELPDVKNDLIDALMESEEFDNVSCDWLQMWVRKID